MAGRRVIDTDTRQLKRRADGTYTSGGTSKAGGRKIPCSHCAVNAKCELQPLTACALFVPAIPFQDEVGLDRLANTVRIGVAWTQRLLIDQVIALYHVRRGEVFGLSRVRWLYAGPIHDMLATHARHNHLMLDQPPETAATTLYNWQRQNYGPRIVHDDTKLTAIYLQRLGSEEAAAYLAEHDTLREQDAASR